jgi:YjjG family noncanonical pyrimidine nucleotidase
MPVYGKKYQFIFFDLDHTLWDFEQNSSETLSELYKKYELEKLGVAGEDLFKEHFQLVNRELWARNEAGRIDRESLRLTRFQLVCEKLGMLNEELANQMGEDYVSLCPTKTLLLPYALDMLEYLHSKYPLYILTNGFSDVQAVKLKSAGILHFFQGVYTGEEFGVQKPEKAYFHGVMEKIGAQARECIMIGDNLKTDILGAQNAGIDHIYYNPAGRSYFMQVQQEINCLSKLRELL